MKQIIFADQTDEFIDLDDPATRLCSVKKPMTIQCGMALSSSLKIASFINLPMTTSNENEIRKLILFED